MSRCLLGKQTIYPFLFHSLSDPVFEKNAPFFSRKISSAFFFDSDSLGSDFAESSRVVIFVCLCCFGILSFGVLLWSVPVTLFNLEYHSCVTMPAERPVSKASENRRATKPIMEKRRRARINQCLSELKTLILDALNKDPSRHSKLEKADILEMTVRHLQNIQRQQMAAAISTDSSVLNKFKAGFNECATEVTRYVSRIEGVDPALRQRLLSHLSNCLTTMNTASSHFQQQQPQATSTITFGGSFPTMLQSLSVQIPHTRGSAGDINNNNSPPSAQSGGKLFAGLSVIPSRLPNGDFAFLLPSHSVPSSGSMSFHLPSVSASSSLPSSSGPDRNSQSSWPPTSPGPERNSQSSWPPTSPGPERNSQSSWPPTSPSSKRSASPDAMSEDNVVLSPTCSDAGSDVFVEPYQTKHHQPVEKMILSPMPHPIHQKDRHMMAMPRHQQVSESENVWRPW